MIIDDGRGLVIHPKNEPFYVTEFRAEEMERLRQTEQQEDLYTKMWKEFSTRLQWRKGRIRVAREICFRYDTENM